MHGEQTTAEKTEEAREKGPTTVSLWAPPWDGRGGGRLITRPRFL